MKNNFAFTAIAPLLTLALYLTCTFSIAQKPVIEWRKLPDLPQAAFGQLVTSCSNGIISAGGTYWKDGNKRWISGTYLLNNSHTNWVKFKRLAYYYAYGAGACYNNYLFISGGNLPDKKVNYRSTALDLSKSSAKWKNAPLLTESMIYPAITQRNNMLYSFGGLSGGEKWQSASAGLRYLNLKNRKMLWTSLKAIPAAGRALAGMCEKDGILYIFGGACLNKSGKLMNLAEAWSFDLKQNKWKRLPNMPFAMRCSLAFPWKQWIILFASCLTDKAGKTQISDKIFLYNTSGKSWRKFGKAPYSAAANGTIRGNKIYLVGGEDKARSRVATCALGIIKIKNKVK